jgi:hypothetical protein
MTNDRFIKLEITIDGDLIRDARTETKIQEYFFISSEYSHDLNPELIANIKRAVKKFEKISMITIDISEGQLHSNENKHVKGFRAVSNYGAWKLAEQQGNQFNFDNVPDDSKISEFYAKVTEFQYHANNLYTSKLIKLTN